MDTKARLGSGLGALLTSFAGGATNAYENSKNRQNQQAQLANQTRQLGFSDPNRPITDRDLLTAAVPSYLQQSQMASLIPGSQPPDMQALLQGLRSALSGQGSPAVQGQGIPQITPSGIPQAGYPQAQPPVQRPIQQQPSAQAPVSRGNRFNIPTLQHLQQARSRGAVGFDDQIGAFVDKNGNPIS